MADRKLLAAALVVSLLSAAATGGTFAVLIDNEDVTLDVVANVPAVGNEPIGNEPVGNTGGPGQSTGNGNGAASSVSATPLYQVSVVGRTADPG